MNETFVVRLNFQTDQNSLYSIRLTNADPLIEQEDIRDAMQQVIDSGVIIHRNGELAGLVSAELIRTETELFDVR